MASNFGDSGYLPETDDNSSDCDIDLSSISEDDDENEPCRTDEFEIISDSSVDAQQTLLLIKDREYDIHKFL